MLLITDRFKAAPPFFFCVIWREVVAVVVVVVVVAVVFGCFAPFKLADLKVQPLSKIMSIVMPIRTGI